MDKNVSNSILVITFVFLVVSLFQPFFYTNAAETITVAPSPPIIGEGGVLDKTANAIFTVLIYISVIVFVIGGFLFLTAGGDPQKFEKAKMTILYAIIGLVVAFGAKALRNFIITKIGGTPTP